ncbi:MAG: PadR family transcriptional regulator [Acidobacteriota bacterium]|jgi:PadR family transcriptional regulator PadR
MAEDRMNLLQGTLDLLVLQTLYAMGPMHGWGIARRLEQVADERIRINYGTMYPALVRLEQRGWIRAEWGASENNRRAKFYALTKVGRERLESEKRDWHAMAAIVDKVLE